MGRNRKSQVPKPHTAKAREVGPFAPVSSLSNEHSAGLVPRQRLHPVYGGRENPNTKVYSLPPWQRPSGTMSSEQHGFRSEFYQRVTDQGVVIQKQLRRFRGIALEQTNLLLKATGEATRSVAVKLVLRLAQISKVTAPCAPPLAQRPARRNRPTYKPLRHPSWRPPESCFNW